MNKTAYLVAHIDVTASPPFVRAVGVYSDRGDLLTSDLVRIRNLDIVSATGEDYEAAMRNLGELIRAASPQYDWVKPMLLKQEKRRLGLLVTESV